MTQRGFPFDAGEGLAYELDWSLMAKKWRRDGIIQGVGAELAVFADSTGMQVKIPAGDAWVRGHYYHNDAQVTTAIAASNATNPRIDRVVLRIDYAANTIRIAVLTGVAAGSPVAPLVTQNDAIYEYSLATVLIDASIGTIAAGKVTNTRNYSAAWQPTEYADLWLTGSGLLSSESSIIRQTRTGAVTSDHQLTPGAQGASNQYGLYNIVANRYEWYTSPGGVLVAPQGFSTAATVVAGTNGSSFAGTSIGGSGLIVTAGGIALNGGNLTSTQTTINAFATTVTSLTIGSSGTTSIFAGPIQVNGNLTSSQATVNLFASTVSTLNIGSGGTTTNLSGGVRGAAGGALVIGNGAAITGSVTITSGRITMGVSTFATGSLYTTASDGTVLTGKIGSATDLLIAGSGGGNILDVPTGTLNLRAYGSITAAAGLFVSASGATIAGGINITSGGITVGAGATASLTGRLQFSGNIAGNAGSIYKDAAGGIVIWGITGSSYDIILLNNSGSGVMQVLAGTSNVNFAGSVTAASFVGTLTTAAQPNITSLGILTGLTVGGTFNYSVNQNAATQIVVTNSTAGAASYAGVNLVSDASTFLISQVASTYATPYTGRSLLQSSSGTGLMIQNTNNGGIWFYGGAASGATLGAYFNGAGSLSPGTDNTVDLGNAGQRWRDVWCARGAFNGSHSSLKDNWVEIAPAAALTVARRARVGTFNYKATDVDDEVSKWTRVGILADAETTDRWLSPDGRSVNGQDTAAVALAAVVAVDDRVEAALARLVALEMAR